MDKTQNTIDMTPTIMTTGKGPTLVPAVITPDKKVKYRSNNRRTGVKNMVEVRKSSSLLSQNTNSTESGQSTETENEEEPWDVDKMNSDNDYDGIGPDDEMNPSGNDTEGCNVLRPLYSMQSICGIRGRAVSPGKSRRNIKDADNDILESDDSGLEDGELPTLSRKKKLNKVSPMTKPVRNNRGSRHTNMNNIHNTLSDTESASESVQLNQPAISKTEMKRVKTFWSQLEVDLDDDEDEEKDEDSHTDDGDSVVTPKAVEISRSSSKKKSPKSRGRRRKKRSPTNRRRSRSMEIKEDEPGMIDSSFNTFCNMARDVSEGFVETFCGGGDIDPIAKPKYYSMDNSEHEQVAIEVEYIGDEDQQTTGSFDEIDELDDHSTVAGSFLQLGMDGNTKRVAQRARSPIRVVITNMPADLRRSVSPRAKEKDPPNLLSENDEDDAPRSHSRSPRKNINSKLGSIAKLSKKKIFPKKAGNTKVKQPVIDVSENTVVSGLTDVKYERTPTKQDESNIEPETDMTGWSDAKKRAFNHLIQKGYSQTECEVMIEEIEEVTEGQFNDVESMNEYCDKDATPKSKSRKSKNRWSRKKSSGSDTGSVSSASTISLRGKQMLNYFRNKGKRKNDVNSGNQTDINEEKKKDSKTPMTFTHKEHQKDTNENVFDEQSLSSPQPPTVSNLVQPVSIEEKNTSKPYSLPEHQADNSKGKMKRSVSPARKKFLNNFNSTRSRPKSMEPTERGLYRTSRSVSPLQQPLLVASNETRNKSAPRGGRTSPLSSRVRPIPGVDDLLKSSLRWDLEPSEKSAKKETSPETETPPVVLETSDFNADIHPSKSTDKWGSILYEPKKVKPTQVSDVFLGPMELSPPPLKTQSTSLLNQSHENAGTSKNWKKKGIQNKDKDMQRIRALSPPVLRKPQSLRMGTSRNKSWSKLNTDESYDSVFAGLDTSASSTGNYKEEDLENHSEVPQNQFILPSRSTDKDTTLNTTTSSSEYAHPRGRMQVKAQNLGPRGKKDRSASTSRGAELRKKRLSMSNNTTGDNITSNQEEDRVEKDLSRITDTSDNEDIEGRKKTPYVSVFVNEMDLRSFGESDDGRSSFYPNMTGNEKKEDIRRAANVENIDSQNDSVSKESVSSADQDDTMFKESNSITTKESSYAHSDSISKGSDNNIPQMRQDDFNHYEKERQNQATNNMRMAAHQNMQMISLPVPVVESEQTNQLRGGAAARRLERAKKVNPWLRDEESGSISTYTHSDSASVSLNTPQMPQDDAGNNSENVVHQSMQRAIVPKNVSEDERANPSRGGAASRRLERAKKVNPWLRDDESASISTKESNYAQSDGASGSYNTPRIPQEDTVHNSENVAHQNMDRLSAPKNVSEDERGNTSRGGGAAARRLERAKQVNPWLRDQAQNEDMKDIKNATPPDLDEYSKSTVSFSLTDEKSISKESISLDTFLEKDKVQTTNVNDNTSTAITIASTLGARSVKTTATDATWRRRNGTSRDRLMKAKEANSSSPNIGWKQSMKLASSKGKVPYHKWNFKEGWVSRPGCEDKANDVTTKLDMDSASTYDPNEEMETTLNIEDIRSESSASACGMSEYSEEASKTPILLKEKFKSDGDNDFWSTNNKYSAQTNNVNRKEETELSNQKNNRGESKSLRLSSNMHSQVNRKEETDSKQNVSLLKNNPDETKIPRVGRNKYSPQINEKEIKPDPALKEDGKRIINKPGKVEAESKAYGSQTNLDPKILFQDDKKEIVEAKNELANFSLNKKTVDKEDSIKLDRNPKVIRNIDERGNVNKIQETVVPGKQESTIPMPIMSVSADKVPLPKSYEKSSRLAKSKFKPEKSTREFKPSTQDVANMAVDRNQNENDMNSSTKMLFQTYFSQPNEDSARTKERSISSGLQESNNDIVNTEGLSTIDVVRQKITKEDKQLFDRDAVNEWSQSQHFDESDELPVKFMREQSNEGNAQTLPNSDYDTKEIEAVDKWQQFYSSSDSSDTERDSIPNVDVRRNFHEKRLPEDDINRYSLLKKKMTELKSSRSRSKKMTELKSSRSTLSDFESKSDIAS